MNSSFLKAPFDPLQWREFTLVGCKLTLYIIYPVIDVDVACTDNRKINCLLSDNAMI